MNSEPDEESCGSDVECTEFDPHLNVPQHNVSAAADAKALLISASDKAGMQNVDRERINAILMRESGNSAFMQRQRKMDEKSEEKIRDMKRKLQEKDAAGGDWRKHLIESTIDPMLNDYRSKRRPRSTCAVIDMDGFFISCHILSNPVLATIPACVGGSSMISTSNYVARRYGVRAAMPGYLGSMLVKELSGGKETLTFVKSDFELYKKKSSEVKTVLEEYDPHLKMYSLDEAYMDIGPYLELKLSNNEMSHDDIKMALSSKEDTREKDGSINSICGESFHAAAQSLLHSIRSKVKDVTGLSCSAGLASNFLIAKVASDVNKPNGQHFIGPSEEQIRNFVHPLACRKISGIGRVTEKILQGTLGIETVRELYEKRAEAFHLFKPATAQFLMRASIGYSESGFNENLGGDDISESLHRKGISHERTFSPISSWTELCTKVETITHALIQDMKERSLRPKTITLKVKLSNFDILSKTFSREVALFQPGSVQQSSKDLVDIVLKLLKEAKSSYSRNHNNTFAVRLLGVRCSNFQLSKDTQLSLDRYCGTLSPRQSREKIELQEGLSPGLVNPYKVSPKRVKISESEENEFVMSSLIENSTDTRSSSPGAVNCPICGVAINSSDNDYVINAHIDSCLNTTAVKQLAKEETALAELKDAKQKKEEEKKKKRSLADFFYPNK